MAYGTTAILYPCDRGTGTPMGYHHFVASPLGVVVCTLCGATPKGVTE